MASLDIQDYGTAVDNKNQQIICTFCSKKVSGYSRLKCHIGGVRGDVAPCPRAPAEVKAVFQKEVLEKRNRNLCKDVGKLPSPNLPLRRKSSSVVDSSEPLASDINQNSEDENEKRVRTGTASGHGKKTFKSNPCSQSVTSRQNSRDFQKAIFKFFIETGLDLNDTNVCSLHRMMSASSGHLHTTDRIPSSEDLKGWILQEVYNEVHVSVRSLRESWATTGCSILLDGWQDSSGRHLLHVLADCPRGTAYIQSADISGFVTDVRYSLYFFDDVLNEVGVENVVQIITYTTSAWMVEVGKRIMEKYKTLFWTVSDSHCIELMLERIGRMKDIQDVLVKAQTITSLVHSDFFALKFMRDMTTIHDLVEPSRFNCLVPFLTLEKMVMKREVIKKIFLSTAWKTSSSGTSAHGKRVTELVADESFWNKADVALKGTMPLVRGLDLLSKTDVPQVAYVYETMDQVKEQIELNFNREESSYQPFWDDIDYVWNNHLHSPLHAAGYFLNPKLCYADGFPDDSEVSDGVNSCFTTLSKNREHLLHSQLEHYMRKDGAFRQGSRRCGSEIFYPGKWWEKFGGEHPELQQLAIRIVSQTCNGATKFQLNRSLAESYLTEGMNPVEKQRLADVMYVHYNMHLQKFNASSDKLKCDGVSPMDQWVRLVGLERPYVPERCGISWADLARKEEPVIPDRDRGGDAGCSSSHTEDQSKGL